MLALQEGYSAYFDLVGLGNLDESSGTYPYPNQTLIKNNSYSSYTVSKRLWAYGNYSRFIRPDAVRFMAGTYDSDLKVVAFRNTDGSIIVVVNSHGSSSKTTTIEGISGGTYTANVTDNSNNLVAGSSTSVGTTGSVSVAIPANSTVTFKFTGSTLGLPDFALGAAATMNATPYTGYGAAKAVDRKPCHLRTGEHQRAVGFHRRSRL